MSTLSEKSERHCYELIESDSDDALDAPNFKNSIKDGSQMRTRFCPIIPICRWRAQSVGDINFRDNFPTRPESRHRFFCLRDEEKVA